MTKRDRENREKVSEAVGRNPGCMFLKAWFMAEAERTQRDFWTIVRRFYLGKYPHIRTEKVNARVVLVLNPMTNEPKPKTAAEWLDVIAKGDLSSPQILKVINQAMAQARDEALEEAAKRLKAAVALDVDLGAFLIEYPKYLKAKGD